MDFSLSQIRGIGPARLKAFEAAGIHTVRELVMFLPKEYRDLSNVTPLAALQAAGSIDSAAVMAALPAVEIDGVSGHIAFDETGDAIRTSAFVKKANNETGDWEFVAEQTVE